MPTYSQTFSARTRYSLVYVVTPGTQEIANNRTLVSWSLRVDETTENGSYAGGSYPWAADVDGWVGSGSTGYDFRNYNTLALGSGSKWVGHNADGTKSISVSAYYGPASTIGSASVSGSFGLTTIPRASTASWAVQETKYMGSTYTINTNRASTGFTHTLEYVFGTKSGVIATGVGDSTTWAIPVDLLTEIPNSATGTGIIKTTTYSGATVIGTTNSNITLTAPLTAVPSFTTITHSEATAGVAAAVGAYVQSISKLNLAITGAAGYQGSTITSYKIEVGTQAVNAASGVTPNPISVSGTVVITGTVTDSRGRTATKTVNATVLAYAPPKFISTPTVQRSGSDGTPNEEGNYLRANINASVQSLLVGGVQKNKLTYKMSTKLKSSGGGMTLKVNTLAPGITFNSYANAGTYSITDAYDVFIEVVDLFATSSILISIPVAKIFMHWDGSDGVGIGKYRENGALDVAGNIYQNGNKVLDTLDIPTFQTMLLDDSYRGGEKAKVVATPGAAVAGEYQWASPYIPQNSRNIRVAKSGTSYQILGQTEDGVYPLTLGTNWYTYEALTNAGTFNGQPRATQLKSGLVVLSGLIRVNGSVADASVIASFPVELAPDSSLLMPVLNNDQIGTIKINTNGTITAYGVPIGNGYISLDGVVFWPAAANIPWTVVGSGGSSFGANFEVWSSGTSEWGQVKYYKDVYGFVWFQGLVRIKVSPTADNTNIVTLPTTHRSDQQQHFRASGPPGVWVGVGALSTNGLNWKTNSVSGVGQYISVSGVVITTTDAVNNNPWKGIPTLANGWGFYSGFVSAVLRREDGLCIARGMLVPSTMGANIFIMPERELYPRAGRLIIAGMSNNANSRTDISAITETAASLYPGSVQVGMGSGWVSLDTLKWVP